MIAKALCASIFLACVQCQPATLPPPSAFIGTCSKWDYSREWERGTHVTPPDSALQHVWLAYTLAPIPLTDCISPNVCAFDNSAALLMIALAMAPLDEGKICTKVFFASSYDNDECGSNGLPLTPNSIRIIGRFQGLTELEHLHLCQYIDMKRGKHGKEQHVVLWCCFIFFIRGL